MRNKTQERVEELARERAAAAIDLGLVEEGIEIGKKMMAEMIATYNGARLGRQPTKPGGSRPHRRRPAQRRTAMAVGYLNEVSAAHRARSECCIASAAPTTSRSSSMR